MRKLLRKDIIGQTATKQIIARELSNRLVYKYKREVESRVKARGLDIKVSIKWFNSYIESCCEFYVDMYQEDEIDKMFTEGLKVQSEYYAIPHIKVRKNILNDEYERVDVKDCDKVRIKLHTMPDFIEFADTIYYGVVNKVALDYQIAQLLDKIEVCKKLIGERVLGGVPTFTVNLRVMAKDYNIDIEILESLKNSFYYRSKESK